MVKNKDLKIIFAGTPEIAKNILTAIIKAGFSIDLVLTRPDRPAGRGQKLSFSPVKQFAIEQNIPLEQPVSFKNTPEIIEKIRLLKPDIIIVVAYGLILPKELLCIPQLGCVNIHVSLLPRWRGAAPIQRTIISGDKISGITIIRMNEGLDTGDILMTKKLHLLDEETSATLNESLTSIGKEMIIEYLQNYHAILPYKQSEIGITYADKVEKEEARINWDEDAMSIVRKIRGFNPTPVAFSFLDKKLIKIWQANVVNETTNIKTGTIIDINKQGIYVACGQNSVLLITELQESGKNRLLASSYIQGHPNLTNKSFSMEQLHDK